MKIGMGLILRWGSVQVVQSTVNGLCNCPHNFFFEKALRDGIIAMVTKQQLFSNSNFSETSI